MKISIARNVAAVFFVIAGVMHFIHPNSYENIVPTQVPFPVAIVVISGVAEILGGLGLMLGRTRRFAGWGLILLLILVFPANVNMALHPETIGRGLPEWALWVRLPLQVVAISWVYVVAIHTAAAKLRKLP